MLWLYGVKLGCYIFYSRNKIILYVLNKKIFRNIKQEFNSNPNIIT